MYESEVLFHIYYSNILILLLSTHINCPMGIRRLYFIQWMSCIHLVLAWCLPTVRVIFPLFLPHPRVKVSIVGSLRDREVACSASDRQGSNFESCVWRTVSSQSSHHPQEVLLAQFSLYVHKGGLKPDLFHFLRHFPGIGSALDGSLVYLTLKQCWFNVGHRLRRWTNVK